MNARKYIKKLVAEGVSQTDIARKCGLSNGTITKILYSETVLTLDTIKKIATAYNLPLAELLSIPVPAIAEPSVSYFARKIPVISQAQAGDNGYWEDCYPVGRALEWLPCPGTVTDPHAFAVRVEGDSMAPRYYSGENVIVDTTKEVINNDDVLVKLTDGRVMVKRYRRTNGMILLESYNATIDPIIISQTDISCCYKIVCRM